eukprot:TRINITY_DN59036_c0_g1_i3.p1 TRINITY_DN59036_c0_g1~~TRINITY_DN59036_c0_g1_i3.p1  ORF type:complete len:901 (-),score=148.23 TRINITY_DN59036_c0_g1_i3:306-2864(-)
MSSGCRTHGLAMTPSALQGGTASPVPCGRSGGAQLLPAAVDESLRSGRRSCHRDCHARALQPRAPAAWPFSTAGPASGARPPRTRTWSFLQSRRRPKGRVGRIAGCPEARSVSLRAALRSDGAAHRRLIREILARDQFAELLLLAAKKTHLLAGDSDAALLCFIRLGKYAGQLRSSSKRLSPPAARTVHSLARRLQRALPRFQGRDLSSCMLAAYYIVNGLSESAAKTAAGSSSIVLADLFELASGCGEELASRGEQEGASPQDLSNAAWAWASLMQLGAEQRAGAPWLGQLAGQASSQLHRFSSLDVAKFVWACAQLSDSQSNLKDVVQVVAGNVRERCNEFDGRVMASFAWAFATSSIRDDHLFDSIAAELTKSAKMLKPQELSNGLWAFAAATMGESISGKRAIGALAKASEAKAAAFAPQGLSNVAWALAKLKPLGVLADEDCARLMRKLLARACDDAAAFGLQEATNLMWAAAKAEVFDEEIASVLLHASRGLGVFLPQHLSSIVWSYATARAVPEERIWTELGRRATGDEEEDAFTSQGLANLAWSAASLAYDDPDLWRFVSAAARRSLHRFNPQELSNIMWALATLAAGDARLREALARRAAECLERMNLADMSNCAWAVVTLTDSSNALLPAIGKRLAKITEQVREGCQEARCGRGRDHDVAVDILGVAWSLSFAGLLEQGLLDEVRLTLQHIGRWRDDSSTSSGSVAGGASATALPKEQAAESTAHLPRPQCVLDLTDCLVLQKPPGWQVDTSRQSVRDTLLLGRGSLSTVLVSEGVEGKRLLRSHPILIDDACRLGCSKFGLDPCGKDLRGLLRPAAAARQRLPAQGVHPSPPWASSQGAAA